MTREEKASMDTDQFIINYFNEFGIRLTKINEPSKLQFILYNSWTWQKVQVFTYAESGIPVTQENSIACILKRQKLPYKGRKEF